MKISNFDTRKLIDIRFFETGILRKLGICANTTLAVWKNTAQTVSDDKHFFLDKTLPMQQMTFKLEIVAEESACLFDSG